MNYMINNEASKQVAIAFANWVMINGMGAHTMEEQYERWMVVLDHQATSEVVDDTVDMEKWDDFEHQLEYMAGVYED